MLWIALVACHAPVPPLGSPTDTAQPCESGRPPYDFADAETWELTGVPDVDDDLGDATSVGDIDGDGLADIAVAEGGSAYMYLILGSTLRDLPHGSHPLRDVADYVFDLPTSSPIHGSYRGHDDSLAMVDGALWIADPRADATLPMVYRIPWSALRAAGPGAYAPDALADFRIVGTNTLGGLPILCDVTGDGQVDLVLHSTWLFRGPFAAGATLDSDVDAIPLVRAAHSAWRVQTCADLNGDGIGDLGTIAELYTSDTENDIDSFDVYYGGPSLIAGGAITQGAPDVSISFEESDGTRPVLSVPSEAIGDVNGDGYPDVALQLIEDYWPKQPPEVSWISLFLGGPGFFPSGTQLGEADHDLRISSGDSAVSGWGAFGVGASLQADLNGDGTDDLVVGEPGEDYAQGGRVFLRYCPFDPGTYDHDEFFETTWTGPDEDGTPAFMGAHIGTGDIDNNGRTDLVIAAPEAVGGLRASDNYAYESGALFIVER